MSPGETILSLSMSQLGGRTRADGNNRPLTLPPPTPPPPLLQSVRSSPGACTPSSGSTTRSRSTPSRPSAGRCTSPSSRPASPWTGRSSSSSRCGPTSRGRCSASSSTTSGTSSPTCTTVTEVGKKTRTLPKVTAVASPWIYPLGSCQPVILTGRLVQEFIKRKVRFFTTKALRVCFKVNLLKKKNLSVEIRKVSPLLHLLEPLFQNDCVKTMQPWKISLL